MTLAKRRDHYLRKLKEKLKKGYKIFKENREVADVLTKAKEVCFVNGNREVLKNYTTLDGIQIGLKTMEDIDNYFSKFEVWEVYKGNNVIVSNKFNPEIKSPEKVKTTLTFTYELVNKLECDIFYGGETDLKKIKKMEEEELAKLRWEDLSEMLYDCPKPRIKVKVEEWDDE